jgi:crossover junction endodeoxyribonuclease RusA
MFRLFVQGKPAPAGSKRAIAFKGRDGKLHSSVIDDAKGGAQWRAAVSLAAQDEFQAPPSAAPLALCLTFFRLRPKSHYTKSGKLKGKVEDYPTKKPDSTKLLRAVEDALTAIVWIDDAQIVDTHVYKRFGDIEGVDISVFRLDPGSEEEAQP